MIKFKIKFTLIFCLVAFYAIGQESSSNLKDKQNALFTIRSQAGIPTTISSNAFRFAFKGIYDIDLSVNARPFGNFFAGLGYERCEFKINKAEFVRYQAPPKNPNQPNTNYTLAYDTKLRVNNVFINLGYDKFKKDNIYLSLSLQAGVTFSKYTDGIPDSSGYNKPFQSPEFTSPYLRPCSSVNFIVSPKLAFNLFFNYTNLLTNFDPRDPRINQFESVTEKSNKQGIGWITFGFGFNVLLDKKKK